MSAKFSRKFKNQLKKRLASATAILAVLVLVFACPKITTYKVETSMATVENADSTAPKNEIAVLKDSTGINLDITGFDENGISTIEVYQGTNKIKTYTYTDGATTHEEKFSISIPFGATHEITVMVNGETVAQKNVQNMRYIYNVTDFVAFRNAVNNGNNFSGKYVELMANINLSSVCSSSVGSWNPIGSGSVRFLGTFNGNYYTISNLYINSGTWRFAGLFYGANASTVIENLSVSNVNITNTNNTKNASSYAGGIAGYMNGTMFNCANLGGTVYQNSTTAQGTDDNHHTCHSAGGLAGSCAAGASLRNCFNKATIKANCSTTLAYTQSRAGGLVGNSSGSLLIENCYNTGAITSTGKIQNAGGIVGMVGDGSVLKNSYSTGTITISIGYNKGGVTSRDSGGDGNGGTKKYGTVTNCYYLSTSCDKLYRTYNASSKTWSNVTTGSTTAANMKVASFVSKLGSSAWIADTYNKNSGYPILRWQIPYFELSKNQVYLHQNEQLQLNTVTSKTTVSVGTISWASSDTSVATVDSTGKVTAVGEGYATIYATESTYSLKAMCIVNVAKTGAVAFPAIGTSSDISHGFSVVLKEDGTVWTTGSGSAGEMGDGRATNSLYPVQVMIDKDTPLKNIVKIAVGYNHTLALSADGRVYAWGRNSNGQLGINNTTDKYYATPVLNYEGTEELRNIVDISAGYLGSSALDEGGLVYTWGYNSYGQLGIGNTTDKYLPQVALCAKAVRVSSGGEDTSILTVDGRLMSWGVGANGRLGLGNTTNFTTGQTTSAYSIVDIYRAYNKLIVLSTNGSAYVCGYNTFGDYGDGTTTQVTSIKQITTPGTSKIKYISGSARNIVFLMKDGTIWAAGGNSFGQLSNGSTAEKVTSYVQAKNADGSYVTNARSLGMMIATQGTATDSATRAQNIAYIGNDGNAYIVGANNCGQFGNGTTTNSSYYTKMGAPYLNYKKAQITLKASESVTLDSSDFEILEEFNVNNDFVKSTIGALTFSTDSSNVQINGNKITGATEGYAKIKVEDTNTGYSTYIPVRVVNNTPTKMALGSKFTMSLRANGEVYTWGQNAFGELGQNTNVQYVNEPQKVGTLSDIKDIDAGLYHALALDENGNVYSWGLNNNGQLGNGNTTSTNVPEKVAGLSNIVKISAYKYLSLALDEDNNLYAWGEGYSSTPTKIFENIIDISEDKILTTEHKIKTLGNMPIHNLRGIYNFSANDDGLLAVSNEGKALQLYNNDTINDLGITNAADVSAGKGYGIILNENGTAYTFGVNDSGQLGNGSTTTITTPAQINVANVEIIAAGEGEHSAVGDYEGSIFTTGWNDKGQLGHKNVDNKVDYEIVLNVVIESNVDKIVKQIGETENVDVGLAITLNLKKDLTQDSETTISIVDSTIAELTQNVDETYTVTGKTIGRTFLNATILGNIQGEQRQFAANIEVRIVPEGGVTVPQVKAGKDFTVALKADGTVESWGGNQYGQLGLGNKDNYDEPQKIGQIEETIVEIAVGENHVLALTENGTIYGWGLNDSGQVGNGTLANQVSQATVINIYGNELGKIIRVEAHGDNSFAIDEEGKVYAWGKDYKNKAEKLDGLENAIDVSTNYYVKADGTVYDMTNLESLTIVGKVRTMDEGTDHAIFLTTEGMAYSIGNNTFGQLGIGNTTPADGRVEAVRKSTSEVFNNVSAVEAGDRYSVILTSDGKVYTFGINSNGIQGEEPSQTSSIVIAKECSDLSDVLLISAGGSHIVAAKNDGTTYSWGLNEVGQLGNRAIKNSIIPVMVGEYVVRANENHVNEGEGDTYVLKAYVDYFNIIKEDIIPMNIQSKNSQVARAALVNGDEVELSDEEVAKGYCGISVEGVKKGTTNIILTPRINGVANNKYSGIVNVEVLKTCPAGISPMIETTANHTVMLKSNGTVWTYGQNAYGQLGTGTELSIEDEPKQVNFSEDVIIKQIAAGEFHSVALDTEGNVWTWGRNNYYQLGVSNVDSSSEPIKVTGIPKVTRIAAGNNSVMAITEDNKLVGWGQNAYGELGTGTVANKQTPVVIEGMHDVLDIQGGKSHYIVLKTNGRLYAVGSNLYGQLGVDLGEKSRTTTYEYIDHAQRFARISSSWTSNMAVTVDGQVYSWGQNTNGQLGTGDREKKGTLTKVEGVSNIVEVSIGKTHSIVRDYNENVYVVGVNSNGQLGDGTTTGLDNFKKSDSIENVLRVAAGNTYTVVMKDDGTVWAWGDYNHGNKTLKSRTNSKVPIQLGSDISSVDKLELVIKISETEQITAEGEYRFNLMYEDESSTSDLEYECLNNDIAIVNENGGVLGVRTGTTWVKVTDRATDKVSVVIVRVVDNAEGYQVYTTPKIATGDGYAASLREDGSIYIWGYDGNEMVDSDIPFNMNIVSTYVDLKSGNGHIVALRADGTVWVAGDNSYGQLGLGHNRKQVRLVQIQGLTDIEKIATGDNFSIAMDSYGIIYAWGEGYSNKPQQINTNIRSASYIAAGSKDQIAVVLPDGTIFGFGSILDGKLDDIDNAVKVEIGEDYLLILDTDGQIHKYKNGNLTNIGASNIVDISVKNNVNMCQNVNEKAFTWGENSKGQLGNNSVVDTNLPVKPDEYSDNVFTISAGISNTYITDVNGNVYAAGDNSYGQIGNGTKEDNEAQSHGQSNVHTLVGDREFTVQPETAIMSENDIEMLNIVGNSYNVFKNQTTKNVNDFDVVSNDTSVIDLLKDGEDNFTGEIKALAIGKTSIDITDKVTNKQVSIERRVVELEQNRISFVTANGEEADVTDPSDVDSYIAKYNVEVALDDDETSATLIITTRDATDQISIDDGETFETGKLETSLEILNEYVEKIITVKVANGTIFKYELRVERISTNNKVKTIKVNGFEAVQSETDKNVYEIVVTDKTDLTDIDNPVYNTVEVTAEKAEAKVSIKGKEASLSSQTFETDIEKGFVEIPIKVTAESGLVQNYTLRIYTTDELLKLKSVYVNGESATEQQDGTYLSAIADDVNRSTIEATAEYENINVQLNNLLADQMVTTRTVVTTDIETEVSITLSATLVVDGVSDTVSKEYILKINKNKSFSMIQELKVNDEVIEEENNTYIAYVTSNVNDAIIDITAVEADYRIKLDEDSNSGNLHLIKELSQDETTYTFTVTDENSGDKKNYTLKIIRGNNDTGIKRITVGKDSYVVEAELTDELIEDKPVYVARVIDRYTDADVTVQAANKNSKININNGFVDIPKIAMSNVTLNDKVVEIPITITTEDDQTSKEYVLRIIKQNDNTVLESLVVNDGADITATLEDEKDSTRYEVHLNNATKSVEITGIAENDKSQVSINGEEKQIKESTITLDLTQAITEVEIKVISEAGTEQTYYLTIYTISDDVSLEYIKVNGTEAVWNNTNKRYEIKVDRDIASYRVEAMTTEENAKITIGNVTNTCSIIKSITSEANETDVMIGVTAPNEITTSNYKLAIIEKSNNAELGYVKINGKMIAPNDEGNYYLEVVSSVQSVLIQVGAQESNATINVDNEDQIGVWKNTRALQTDLETYDINITAEDGTTKGGQHEIIIKRLDGSTDIDSISVSYLKGEDTISAIPTKLDDGSYYIKIRRPSEERVTLDIKAKKGTTKINILGTEESGKLVGYLNLSGEITIAPIIMTAEDGSTYQTTIKIEKQSNNTDLQQFTALEGTITGSYQINADSKDSKLTITVVPADSRAKVKLSGSEDEYASRLTNLVVDTSGKDEVSVDVIAEDGETVRTHTLQIIRTYKADLASAKVNGSNVNTGSSINVVNSTNANLVLTALNDDAEIYLLKDGAEIATGIGTLTADLELDEENAKSYTIRIKGPGKYVIYQKEYELKLRANSTDNTGSIYVDGRALTLNEDTGFYEVSVNGESHTIKGTTNSEYGRVSIQGATASSQSQTRDVSISPEQTNTYTVKLIAEDGTAQECKVKIYRRNNDVSVKKLSVCTIVDNAYGTEKTLTSLADGSYYWKIKRNIENISIYALANDEKAKVSINNGDEARSEKDEIIKIASDKEYVIIPIKIVAEDGTEKIVDLKVEKESNDVSLKKVLNGKTEATKVDENTYKVQVDSRAKKIEFTAIPTNAYAKIKLATDSAYSEYLVGVDVNIEGINSFDVDVLAEDGETAETYTIQIERIFDASMKELKVDDEVVKSENEAFSTYVVANQLSHTIKITAENEDAVITLYDKDGTEMTSSTGVLEYAEASLGTSRDYKIVIKGPSDYESFTKEYTLKVTEKSTDATAKLYIDDTQIEPDPNTGKYRYVTTNTNNMLKVMATSSFATITVNGCVPVNALYERNHSVQTGTTETINVVVTSQNGESETYVVELVKLSDNKNIASIQVNEKESTKISDNLYKNVQATTETNGKVVITLEDSSATVEAIVGEDTFDSISEENGKKKLEFDISLPGIGTTDVTIEVTAEDGSTKTATLNIVQNPSNNINVTVKVNDNEAEKLDNSTYRIFVNNRDTLSTVNIVAEDENTTIKSIDNTADIKNSITFDKTLNTEDDVTVVNFTVISQNGIEQDCDLYIIKESTDNTIGKLYVNGLEINKGDNGRYTAYIENTDGNPTVKVVTNNEFAYVRIDTFAEAQKESEQVVKLGEQKTTSVPIKIRSQSGEEREEHLDLIVTFVTARLEEVIVDDEEVTDYNEDTRTYIALVENALEEHEIYVVADNNFMTLEINEEISHSGSVTTTMSFEEGEEIREFTLYVTGETGITEEYTIILAQKSSNVDIKSVKVNDVSLSMDISKNEYKKSIDMVATRAKIEVETVYPYATIKIGDNAEVYGKSGAVWVDLIDQPEIIIPVVVRAADGNTIETYNIVLTRVASKIEGKIITQNAKGEHVATIKVYRSSDTRKIDDPDENNRREVIAEITTKDDGTYEIFVPNADEYDMIIEKEGYLTHTITNVKAVAYDKVSVKDINIYAGNIIKYTYIGQEEPIEQVEVQDLVALNDNYGETITAANWLEYHIYDLNEDGEVDKKDRDILKANFNKKAETEQWTDPNAPVATPMRMSVARMATASTVASTVASGSFIIPLNSDYTITSPYGERVHPVTGEVKKHRGIDISGEHHAEVLAVADGVVTFAGTQSGYGYCIEIKHVVNGETIYSFYAHLSQINVEEGEEVAQGQVIALEGGAKDDPGHGTSTGHHLHFEIRTANGSRNDVNPCDYINF